MLKVSFLTSSKKHKVYPAIIKWVKQLESSGYQVEVHLTSNSLQSGDFLFLVSCSEIVSEAVRSRFAKCLVLHASDLPNGRGWSPHIWDILSGKNEITVSLIHASHPVDSGDIIYQTSFKLNGYELLDDINYQLFKVEYELVLKCLNSANKLPSRKQNDSSASYWEKRSELDSELDINKTIKEQFNLLRVVDNEHYPAFFRHLGSKYVLKIERLEDASS